MKKQIFITLFVLFSVASYAQNDATSEMQKLYYNDEFEKIIELYEASPEEYSSEDLYYVGLAHYMLDNYDEGLRFADMAIENDPEMEKAVFLKGMLLLETGDPFSAIELLENGVAMHPEDYHLRYCLGMSYNIAGYTDKAIPTLWEANNMSNKEEGQHEAISLLLGIYQSSGDNETFLNTLYEAESSFTKTDEFRNKVLFDIGIIETRNGRYDEAEKILLKLLIEFPDDYNAYSRLVQVYNIQGKYKKAEPFKKIMYDAHARALLPEAISDMFCIDQFNCGGKDVLVFERFESGHSEKIYRKHIFYVLDENGNIECTLQSEYSPTALALTGDKKYILCKTSDNGHANYGYMMSEGYSYKDLKKEAMKYIARL